MFGKVELTQLCELQRENNALLRELLVALGRNPTTAKVAGLSPRIFTDKDVSIVSRQQRMEQQLAREAQTAAPWRTPDNGQDSGTTSVPSGSKSAAAKPDDSPV